MNKMSGKFVGKFLKKELLDVETMDETAIINLRIKDIPTCRRDESKDKFPWKSQEVHDVVAA